MPLHQKVNAMKPFVMIGCAIAVAVLSPALLVGCEKNQPADQQAAEQENADTLVEYTVRGRVEQLPGGPEFPAREFMVRHEEIPEFRSSMTPGDERIGMRSMSMAFPLAEGVSLDGVEPGTLVELMFETVYDGESGRLEGYTVQRLTILDATTELQIPAAPAPRLP